VEDIIKMVTAVAVGEYYMMGRSAEARKDK
jgi:hypothetical protein